MDNEIKVSLSQGLRDNLIFDLFASDDTKSDVAAIKEEHLRTEFKRLWVAMFCFTCKTSLPDKDFNHRVSKEEVHIFFDNFTAAYTDLLIKLLKSPFSSIGLKYFFEIDNMISKVEISDSDLDITSWRKQS